MKFLEITSYLGIVACILGGLISIANEISNSLRFPVPGAVIFLAGIVVITFSLVGMLASTPKFPNKP